MPAIQQRDSEYFRGENVPLSRLVNSGPFVSD
jgi:hypothetical protein